MNRTGFMIRLDSHLEILSDSEKAEIFADINEHFDIATSQGKTEEEIIQALGAPEDIAAQYVPQKLETATAEIILQGNQQTSQTQYTQVNEGNDAKGGKIALAIILAFFSITTILPVMFSIAMAIISLIISGGSIVFVGFIEALSGTIENVIPGLISGLPFGNTANIFFGIATICFGFLWTVGWLYVCKKYWILVKKYFTFFINILKLK